MAEIRTRRRLRLAWSTALTLLAAAPAAASCGADDEIAENARAAGASGSGAAGLSHGGAAGAPNGEGDSGGPANGGSKAAGGAAGQAGSPAGGMAGAETGVSGQGGRGEAGDSGSSGAAGDFGEGGEGGELSGGAGSPSGGAGSPSGGAGSPSGGGAGGGGAGTGAAGAGASGAAGGTGGVGGTAGAGGVGGTAGTGGSGGIPGLDEPCSNGPGWTLFRFHYASSAQTTAIVDVWDATCSYSLGASSTCLVELVGSVTTTSTGAYAIVLDSSDLLRIRFSVQGLSFSVAALHVQARSFSTNASTNIRAWSPIHGEGVVGPVDHDFTFDWYGLDWTGKVLSSDPPAATAIQIYPHLGSASLAVHAVELCLE